MATKQYKEVNYNFKSVYGTPREGDVNALIAEMDEKLDELLHKAGVRPT